MTLDKLWTTTGLLSKYGNRAVCLRYPIMVEPIESNNSDSDSEVRREAIAAGLVEMTMRVGLECLFVPTPILGKVFVHQANFVRDSRDLEGTLAVFGSTRDWLENTLAQLNGLNENEFFCLFDDLDDGEGILYLDDSGVLVGAAKSERGLLSVMRAVASDNFGHGFPCAKRVAIRGTVPSDEWTISPRSDAPSTVELSHLFSDIGSGSKETLFPELDMQFGALTAPGAKPHGVEGEIERAIESVAEEDQESALECALEGVLSLSARLGLEVERVQFPVTSIHGEKFRQSAVQLQFCVNPNENVSFVASKGREIEFVAPSGQKLQDMLFDVIDSWFEQPNDVEVTDWRGRIAALASPAPDIRRRATAELLLTDFAIQHAGVQRIVAPSHLQKAVEPWAESHGADFVISPEPLLRAIQWQGESEWNQMKGQLREDLKRVIQEAQSSDNVILEGVYLQRSDAALRNIQVEVFTTVPHETFEQNVEKLRAELRAELGTDLPLDPSAEPRAELGAGPLADPERNGSMSNFLNVDFQYRNVTKPGLSWFVSDVLPVLKGDLSVFEIEISARRVPAGAGLLDLPQRYLQEFFPIDAILEREIGLPSDRVHLQLHDDEGPIYRVTVRNANKQVQKQWSWDSPTETRPYMPPHEDSMILVPAAGYRITDRTSDEQVNVLSMKTVPTVYSQFWDWYQTDVIPSIVSAELIEQGPTAFSRLEVELWVDGNEERHGVYEEVVSWPESAHEDIYFYSLHAFQKHSVAANDVKWKSPGLVVPLVHLDSSSASPRAEVRLFDYQAQELTVWASDSGDGERINIRDVKTSMQTNMPTDMQFEVKEIKRVNFESGVWNVVAEESGVARTDSVLTWLNERVPTKTKLQAVPESRLDSPGLPISFEDNEIRVLQNNDVIAWLNEERDSLPGRHFVVDYSFHGRPIIGVELYDGVPGLTSRHKHALFKPTLLIFARHHANEVSSTNSAVRLVRDIMAHDITDSGMVGRTDLLGTFNLVLVPIHNTDGAALHRRLMEEHPFWKHHAARFNACGYEFGHDYFKPDTQFGESRVAARLWDLWKPDIVLDDHGIPSHEWIQPFAGYNSPPSFPESYWIPHAQIYTIWRELHPELEPDREGLIMTVARALSEDADIRRRNEEFLARYRKWGQQFSPDQFPASAVEGVITYRWKASASTASKDYIGRFPHWVTADVITEVNDETVHGKALSEVVHAHSKAHEGIVTWLLHSDTELRRSFGNDGGEQSWVRLERKRPL